MGTINLLLSSQPVIWYLIFFNQYNYVYFTSFSNGDLYSLPVCRDELYLKFNKGKEGNVNGFKDFSGRNIHVAQRDIVISALGDGMMKMNGNSSCLNIWRFSNIEYR